jgi:hypothetical protein
MAAILAGSRRNQINEAARKQKAQMTPEEKAKKAWTRAKIEERVAAIELAVKGQWREIASADAHLRDYLRLAGTVAERYSAANTAAVRARNPKARFVQTGYAWSKKGFRIKKVIDETSGKEKSVYPIHILKCNGSKFIVKGREVDENGEEHVDGYTRDTIGVYDETMVEPDPDATVPVVPIPELVDPVPLSGDSPEAGDLVEKLVQWGVRAGGIKGRAAADTHGVDAYYDAASKTILVD